MNVITVIQADLEVTTLGTKSRLGDEIGGEPVLRRTVRRVERIEPIGRVFVLCPPAQTQRVAALLAGTRAEVGHVDCGDAPWRTLIRSARKWSLDGWRGGIGGAASYDEFVDCRAVARLLAGQKADAVLCVPPAAPALSPKLATGMIELLQRTADDSRMVFAQAPPGLTGLLMQPDLVEELAAQTMPVGWVFSYKPDTPRKDLIFLPCCYELPSALRYASARLTADTDRSFRRVAHLLAAHPDDDPDAVGRWLAQNVEANLPPRPREIEIELTTDDSYPDTLMRPRGKRVPARGPIAPALVERLVHEVAQDDDALIVLGGFGDPLLHPEFDAILERIRACLVMPSGVGVCVKTTGVSLTEDHSDALIGQRVDILQVMLDAWSPELYARVQSPNAPHRADLPAVLANLDRLAAMRADRQSALPIVVPDLTKSRDNVDEMEAFYDGWIGRLGAVTITGYADRANQVDDRRVINMAPPTRRPCRRLKSRCLILADGRVTLCDQDFRGLAVVGDLERRDLAAIWMGEEYLRLRAAHENGTTDALTLCAPCTEWHRD